MGLLDDAIREHLELKRRHGADPEEVSRQEQEALGPVRRGDSLEVPDRSEPAAEPEAAHASDDAYGAPAPAYEEPVVADEQPAPAYDEPAPVHDEPAPHRDDPVAAAPEPPVVEEPPAFDPPPGDVSQPTVAFSLEDVESDEDLEPPVRPVDDRPRAAAQPPADVVPADEEGEEDELAETPEFLQETPEHDRLWFEQKPPRDFDF